MSGDLTGQRIAVYARFSTDRQNQSSCADQIAKLGRYIRERGGELDPALVYRDEGVSGAVWDRPGLGALLDAVRAGDVDVLVVEDLGRVSRDTEDGARIRKLLEHTRVRLLAIDDGLDTAREGAALMGDLFGAFKSQVRREVSAKTRRGMEGRARAGKATGGLAFGYRSVPGPDGAAIEIDAEAARLVVEVFESWASGRSLAGIAADLNAREVPPPRAKGGRSRGEWLPTTVRSILKNERYTGRWAFGWTVWTLDPETRKRRPRKRDAPLHVEERPELAIVTADLWRRALARFETTRTVYTGRRTVPAGRLTYPLSGVLFCGACGSTMTITGGAKDRRYYGCTAARRGTCDVRGHWLESLVRERVIGGIRARLDGERDTIARMLDDEVRLARGSDERRAVAARIERRETEIRRAVDFLLSGPSDAVRGRLAALEAAQRADRALLSRLHAEARMPAVVVTADDVLDGLGRALSGATGEVRAALRDLLDGGRLDVVGDEARGRLIPPVSLATGVDCGGAQVTGVAPWELRISLAKVAA